MRYRCCEVYLISPHRRDLFGRRRFDPQRRGQANCQLTHRSQLAFTKYVGCGHMCTSVLHLIETVLRLTATRILWSSSTDKNHQKKGAPLRPTHIVATHSIMCTLSSSINQAQCRFRPSVPRLPFLHHPQPTQCTLAAESPVRRLVKTSNLFLCNLKYTRRLFNVQVNLHTVRRGNIEKPKRTATPPTQLGTAHRWFPTLVARPWLASGFEQDEQATITNAYHSTCRWRTAADPVW